MRLRSSREGRYYHCLTADTSADEAGLGASHRNLYFTIQCAILILIGELACYSVSKLLNEALKVRAVVNCFEHVNP
jgi:hypothetical protein